MLLAWEALAVGLSLAYLILAVHERSSCWYAAFAGTCIYLVLFWRVNLLMETGLQFYYLAMAGYGWWQWRHGTGADGTLRISRWQNRQHGLALGAVLILSVGSGALLQRYTGAVAPFLDSFTSWGAVLTTWMVARKVLENWLYWLVIDALSIYLYLDRELYLTAALFLAYMVIALFGFRQWLQHYRRQTG